MSDPAELTPEQQALAKLAEAIELLAFRTSGWIGTDDAGRAMTLAKEAHDLVGGSTDE